ncbi:hypothetical protein JCM5350_005372 [Sporobolomyces pararoseus]
MSLDTLPYEMFQFITSPLAKRDLLSLCLVNKKLLPFAQPLLFRTVILIISAPWYQEYNRSESQNSYERARNCFFRTLSTLPSFAFSIASLSLKFDLLSFNDSPRVPLTISLLQNAINLRHLYLDGYISQEGCLPSEVIDVVPSTLRSLEIGTKVLDQAGLQRILARLISLESLDLSKTRLIGQQTISNAVVLSGKLARLRFPQTDVEWSPFFDSIVLKASKSLESFEGPFVSVHALSATDFPVLDELRLICGLKDINGEWESGASAYQEESQPFFRDLRLTLSKTPQLQRLEFKIDYCTGPKLHPVTNISLFDLMPSSIRHIDFRGPSLFPPEALLRFLASTSASINLRSLEVWRFGSNEEALEDQVEELCEMREIQLKWRLWNFD